MPCELHRVHAIDNIPADCKYPLQSIILAQNRKQTDTGGLAKCLELKVGAKVMVTVKVDVNNRLINGQAGEVLGLKLLMLYIKYI